MARHYSSDTVDEIMNNTEILMQFLMDSSKTRVSDIIADIEEISRNLIIIGEHPVKLNRLNKCHIQY
jgi:hypothetical protein